MRRALFLVVVIASLMLGGALLRLGLMLPRPAEAMPGSEVAGHYDYAGIVHGHSGFSGDAYGSYDDLAGAAAAQGLRFLALTEHNNLRATLEGMEGWHHGVLMLSGVESSRPEGYLLALGTRSYQTARTDATDRFLAEAASQDGVVLIAHPGRPKWQWSGPVDSRIAGMEILDLADCFYAAPLLDKLALVLLYPFRREAAFLTVYDAPEAGLQRWDAVNATRPFVGTYGPDFHQSIGLVGSLKLHWPPAGDLMRFARDHVLLDRPLATEAPVARGQVLGGIGRGHLYVSVDLVGDATGFMFAATRGSAQAWMGDTLAGTGAARFRVDLPPSAERLHPVVRLLRDGVELERQPWRGQPVEFTGVQAGAYRVEVRVRVPRFFGGTREIVWIYANPIHLAVAS
ncbi:hypothetical protein KHC28_17370 [Ancylobacter sonchi]|uniref:hypothetical protein n=1 Tax=Ancylobacter sonchi TaxID=1937790 RepID=UPI001BD5B5D8|nr:hypothetical protein [Ancylobacter sonchi]MBS7535424.1 hypothetical protein [Ancylobacter sonchi]